MLQRLDKLRGLKLEASDGSEIGEIKDFYFDDERWAIRYMVVDASSWLGRTVLLSPLSFNRLDLDRKRVTLSATRDQVKNSPAFDVRQPLSRRWEATYAAYYRYPYYWGGSDLWGSEASPVGLGRTTMTGQYSPDQFPESEVRQKSVSQVLGFHIRALDGEVGHVDDFIVDLDNWKIRYLLADTSNFIGGKWVLISPDWARRVDWNNLTFNVDMNTADVKNSPEYDPKHPIERTFETKLHDYYHRPAYWR